MVNKMAIKVNLSVKDGVWRPGLPLINDPKYKLNTLPYDKKIEVLEDFSKYLAEQMKKLLIRRIKTQYSYLRWKPLTPGYEEFKKKSGLSSNIWEATGLLVNSIICYKESNFYVVGIDPRAKYPNSKVSVLFVAKCMEFGTRYMPARPLFGPTVSFMRRHVRKYWEKFLIDNIKKGV